VRQACCGWQKAGSRRGVGGQLRSAKIWDSVGDRASKVLVMADRMVRNTRCGCEAEFLKISRLHKDWWLMPAGDDVGPALSFICYLL